MSMDQLFGKYRRLKKDLSAAYSQPQRNAALVDRLVDEIGVVERELAHYAPPGMAGPVGMPASARRDVGRGVDAGG